MLIWFSACEVAEIMARSSPCTAPWLGRVVGPDPTRRLPSPQPAPTLRPPARPGANTNPLPSIHPGSPGARCLAPSRPIAVSP
ncbi:hypothetical protein B0H10DRAFT_176419 [Mycena sp. CBHHK59/15]|nr:hypothetical protein B0H10DRAFT_176419 [Mycena sp. CBHHK59/15]